MNVRVNRCRLDFTKDSQNGSSVIDIEVASSTSTTPGILRVEDTVISAREGVAAINLRGGGNLRTLFIMDIDNVDFTSFLPAASLNSAVIAIGAPLFLTGGIHRFGLNSPSVGLRMSGATDRNSGRALEVSRSIFTGGGFSWDVADEGNLLTVKDTCYESSRSSGEAIVQIFESVVTSGSCPISTAGPTDPGPSAAN